jgi:hypothetical protein
MTDQNDLQAEIEHLKRLLEGTRLLTLGLMIALVHNKVITVESLSQALDVTSKYAKASQPSGTSLPIEHARLLLEDLCQNGRIDPELALLHIAIDHLQAGPERQHALRTWLTQASAEELANEIRQLLEERAR